MKLTGYILRTYNGLYLKVIDKFRNEYEVTARRDASKLFISKDQALKTVKENEFVHDFYPEYYEIEISLSEIMRL